MPDGSDLVYLEKAGVQYGIAPARKQYAELTAEATGFQLRKLMTPGQVVAYLDKLRGIEFVGEEPLAGRTAVKYRYARTAETQTSAGEVKTESFVYVDKDTGLPLRAELFSEATGNVQGVKGAKIVAEMQNIQTTVDPSLFEIPAWHEQSSGSTGESAGERSDEYRGSGAEDSVDEYELSATAAAHHIANRVTGDESESSTVKVNR